MRRFYSLNNINHLTNDDIIKTVSHIITSYGRTYERKMMHGSINAQLDVTSCPVSQKRVANALHQEALKVHQTRVRDLVISANPMPYTGPYFGYKGYFDQNDKLAQYYDCTSVIVVDGCCRLIAGFTNMPVKNPILICQFVF